MRGTFQSVVAVQDAQIDISFVCLKADPSSLGC